MKIKPILLFLVFIFIFITQSECNTPDQARALFYKGNTYYNEEKFQDAVSQYEQALKSGFESGPLYYNLGNAYFKSGSLGKAILNYSRAKRLMPRDADLISNLTFARSLVKGGVLALQRMFISHLFFTFADLFSLNTLALYSSILYFVLSVLIIFFILMPRLRKIMSYTVVLCAILFIISLSLFSAQYNAIVVQKEAIVVSEKTDSKFEPFADATTFFTLYEGEEVNVVASEKGWVKIQRLDGKQGWVKESDVEPI